MVLIPFEFFISLIVTAILAFVFLIWMVYNNIEDKSSHNDPQQEVEQCPYCSCVFFISHESANSEKQKQDAVRCPVCLSYVEINRRDEKEPLSQGE